MCFSTGIKKEIYLCATCLGKALIEDPSDIYSMNKLGYTWKKTKTINSELE